MTLPDHLQPGSTLGTAMLSPVLAGHLRTWVNDQTILWQVDDPDRLAHMLGRGAVARTEVEPGRYREVGLLDPSGTLLLPDRFTTDGDSVAHPFTLRRAPTEPDPQRQWHDLEHWLSAAALSAAQRGDFLVVETGGWDHQPHPYALFACINPNGTWLSHIEVAPAPTRGDQPWPARPDNPDRATLTAPANHETVTAAGPVLAPAIWEWAPTPLGLAVTYGPHPDGPAPLDLGAPERSATQHRPSTHPTTPADTANASTDPTAVGAQLHRLTANQPHLAPQLTALHQGLIVLGYLPQIPAHVSAPRHATYISYLDPATGRNLGNSNGRTFTFMRADLKKPLSGHPLVKTARYATVPLHTPGAVDLVLTVADQEKHP